MAERNTPEGDERETPERERRETPDPGDNPDDPVNDPRPTLEPYIAELRLRAETILLQVRHVVVVKIEDDGDISIETVDGKIHDLGSELTETEVLVSLGWLIL